MIGFVLAELSDLLLQLDCMSLSELFNTAFRRARNTFTLSKALQSRNLHLLHPLGEMGLALHEMYEVLGLVMGDALYEEYVPTFEELHFLRKEDPEVYETYWEVLCHFHICGQIST